MDKFNNILRRETTNELAGIESSKDVLLRDIRTEISNRVEKYLTGGLANPDQTPIFPCLPVYHTNCPYCNFQSGKGESGLLKVKLRCKTKVK